MTRESILPVSWNTGDEREAGSQTAKAVMRLRQLIVSGELEQGARIRELHVTELLDVSRTPVRAALQQLREEGLVETLPNGGYVVRSFTARDIEEAIELRGVLEGVNARFAAERGVAEEILAELRRIADEIDQVLEPATFEQVGYLGYIELNARFHETLVAASGSALMAQEIARVNLRPFAGNSAMVQIHATVADARYPLLVAQFQHRSVIEALAAREGARAEALMREHARLSRRNLALALASLNKPWLGA